MKLSFPRLVDCGDANKERVVLKATSDGNAGSYLLLACYNVDANQVRDGNVPHTFWFEDKQFRSGDLIILYSKAGETSEKNNVNGNTSHFFYWGKDSSIWNDNLRPVLVESDNWKFSALETG